MTSDETRQASEKPLWVSALRAIAAQKRDYFIEAIREQKIRNKSFHAEASAERGGR